MKVQQVQRSWVEPEQLMALIEAAKPFHRPLIATLAGAGLRAGEAVALNWSDVNLATGVLRVGEAKTAAGAYREVDLPGGLIEALSEWKVASPHPAQGDPVFVTRNGTRQTVTNVDHRIKTAIKDANVRLADLGIELIGDHVAPHSLRRTYASLRAALRDDPVYIAEQLGHTDPAFTFRVYQKAAKRRERLSDGYREAFDAALEWAEMGRIGAQASVGERHADRERPSDPLEQAVNRYAGR